MIKSKHIVITKFNGEEPRKHFREPTVADFTQYSYKGYGQAVEEPFVLKRRPQLYPISWGWNADGRAGNATAVEITSPQIVHKSTQRNYIQGDAGTHHSLLVAENGMVYSYGNGRKGQLGYRNEYMAQAGVKGPKGGIQQTCPRAVTPSGNLLFGTDIKVAQVAAGRFFSVSRQMSVDEGVASVEGLMQSERALKAMLVKFPDSPALLKAWSEVRQERCKVARISGGQLLTWGTGGKGELGHGIYYQYEPKPKIIERLRNVSIIQVSAGRHHCLAISSVYHLYSWGSGRNGKLGHGNFENVHSPEFVQFFDKYYVEACSAGDNHSAVLMRTKRGDRDSQLRRVACFGKGAHGRLGNGKNLMKCDPVLVELWPPSLKGVQIHAISCGGAHTLALCYRSVKKGLANPWGRETYIAAWGFGANGQLGTGYVKDSFVPVKVRMPERCVLICEISAGKSWSMARSIGGELFTWGKGLRGQLGHGGKIANRFRLVPTKVKTFASFVGLSAGHGHNVCISTAKKLYNPKLSIAAAKYPDPFDNPISLTLKPKESESQFRFNCCKRHIHPIRARLRFMCKECNIQSICVVCMRLCHRGHTITERLPVERSAQVAAAEAALKKRKVKVHVDNARQAEKKEQRRITKKSRKKKKKQEEKPSLMAIKSNITTKEYRQKQRALLRTKIPFCCCGMYNSNCCLLPSISEEQAALLGEDGELTTKVERLKNFGLLSSLPLDVRRQQAAIRIQRQAQWYIGRKNIQKLRRDLMDLRRIVCTRYWNKTILEPIWDKLDRARARFREEREREEMEIEHDFKKKYDYLFGLQIALGSCNGMNYAMERWIGGLSIQVPRVIRREVATDSQNILPSHAFSWASVRHQQLQLHPKKRLSVKKLAELTKYVPREFRHEGRPHDIDLLAYTQRFLQDIRSMQWRAVVNARIQAKILARQKALAGARAALLQMKLGGNAAIAKADALLGKGQTAPVESLSRAQQAAKTLRERAEALRQMDIKVEAMLRADREEYDMYAEPKRQHLSVRRRNSIGNPKGMHKRILALRDSLPQQASSKRRNSLPANLKDIYPEQVGSFAS
jgi:alpha-tubulin suppressor-like RCC1 family protein